TILKIVIASEAFKALMTVLVDWLCVQMRNWANGSSKTHRTIKLSTSTMKTCSSNPAHTCRSHLPDRV
ncbi:MAG TPA: hypothetical protein O0X42_04785, partial [Methanocorpusculum sp.]|nr:hypothetical protein [Methanocorpusculum sp.]